MVADRVVAFFRGAVARFFTAAFLLTVFLVGLFRVAPPVFTSDAISFSTISRKGPGFNRS